MTFTRPFSRAHLNNISWPSLYNPATEVGFLGPPARPDGYYLSNPDDIFRFTLYWTLIFHLPFSLIAGVYAFCNFAFPPVRSARETETLDLASPAISMHPSLAYSRPAFHSHSRSGSHAYSHTGSQPPEPPPEPAVLDAWLKPPRLNARRSRWTVSLLVFFAFLVFGLLSAVVGAAVVAFVLVGVYRAGGFYMSTWVPFVWAVIQSLISLLEIWPSVIDII